MIFTTFRRITRTGFVNFWRNGFLSFAAIVVITLSLLAFGLLIFAGAAGRAVISDVKQKVDINIYFTLTAPEQDILSLKKDIEALPQVASVTYVSRDDVLNSFKAKWQDNALIMQGLTEVGDNPFPAELNVKAVEPGQYGGIAAYLEDKNPQASDGTPLIQKINYEENKLIIDRLSHIIPVVEQTGLALSVIFVIVAVIVVWNTIRLITYTARDEMAVMKLVGASNIYVRGPMVVSGIMYGIVSGLIALLVMYLFAVWSDTIVLRLAGVEVASDFDYFVNILGNYFRDNFGQILIIIMGAGIILGGVSSYIAARRYLKV